MFSFCLFVFSPNDGFVVQLQLYEAMGNTVDKTNPAYKEYRLKLLANQLQSVFKLINIENRMNASAFCDIWAWVMFLKFLKLHKQQGSAIWEL